MAEEELDVSVEERITYFLYEYMLEQEVQELLIAQYSGGNDSGMIELDATINELLMDAGFINEELEEFEEDMISITGYGGFNGNFECHGSIYLDISENNTIAQYYSTGSETTWVSTEESGNRMFISNLKSKVAAYNLIEEEFQDTILNSTEVEETNFTSAKRRFVIGDIHNGYKALVQVLERAGFNYEEDELYCVGDYVDGWPDAYEVVEELLKIKNLFLVKGNHDDWFIKYYINTNRDPNIIVDSHWWLTQGGVNTYKSYSKRTTQEFTRHRDLFWNKLEDYIITDDNIVFVHGGWDTSLGLTGTGFVNPETYYWDRKLFQNRLSLRATLRGVDSDSIKESSINIEGYKHIYIGHTSVISQFDSAIKVMPITVGNLTNVDTGAGWHGKLTMVNIDDTTEVYQSDIVKELYPNIEGRG